MKTFSAKYGTSNSLIAFSETCSRLGIEYEAYDSAAFAKRLVDRNEVFAWVKGSYEIGPRALCNRSILASPFLKQNWAHINAKIKMREDFRPFAPVLLAEDAEILFGDRFKCSPFMLTAPQINKSFSDLIPAATHVDYTCRIQIVDRNSSVQLRQTLRAVKKITGWGILLNTSLNMSGESIVTDINDVLELVAVTDLDGLVFEGFFVSKVSNKAAFEQIARQFGSLSEYKKRRRTRYIKGLKDQGHPVNYTLYGAVFENLFDRPVPERRDSDSFYLDLPSKFKVIFDLD
jgi:predicted NodU family carbamoyl transferase